MYNYNRKGIKYNKKLTLIVVCVMIFELKLIKVTKWRDNMRDVYIFEYLNEAEFKKRERSVKMYNMFAFK